MFFKVLTIGLDALTHSVCPFYVDCLLEFFFRNGFDKLRNSIFDFGICAKFLAMKFCCCFFLNWKNLKVAWHQVRTVCRMW